MQGKIRFGTLKCKNIEEITEAWNRCWRGYYYEKSYLPVHMKIWLELSRVLLEHSVSISLGEKVIGFALLSVDGSDGWIAGTCIDPIFRRKGLFAPLMETQIELARQAGLRRIFLEVLKQNYACKVYESTGFTHTRILNIYLPHNSPLLTFRSETIEPLVIVPLEQYFSCRRHAFFNPPWQRREGYLRRYGPTIPILNSSGTAGALFTKDKSSRMLDIWSATADGAEEILSKALERTTHSLALTNQPEDWVTALLNQRGIIPTEKQFEMCIEIQ